MCTACGTMLNAESREHILKLAEEMAYNTIVHINREMDEDNYLDEDESKNLNHCVKVLKNVMCIRKEAFELEDMTYERIEAWSKQPAEAHKASAMAMTAHHTGRSIPTGVPVPPSV